MSYDPALADPISQVRFQLPDIGPVEWLSDTEIDAVLTANAGSVAATVLAIQPSLLGRIALAASSGSDQGTSWSYANRQALLDRLAQQTTLSTGGGVWGSVPRSDATEADEYARPWWWPL